jgi:hypothetical protein
MKPGIVIKFSSWNKDFPARRAPCTVPEAVATE